MINGFGEIFKLQLAQSVFECGVTFFVESVTSKSQRAFDTYLAGVAQGWTDDTPTEFSAVSPVRFLVER